MEIGNEFIVGYGLDYDQVGRGLKDIYVLDNE
jgi:hypoxanthine phosphoribosyltransferase